MTTNSLVCHSSISGVSFPLEGISPDQKVGHLIYPELKGKTEGGPGKVIQSKVLFEGAFLLFKFEVTHSRKGDHFLVPPLLYRY